MLLTLHDTCQALTMKALDYILTLTCIKHLMISSREMALWEKVIVIEPDDLGSVPGPAWGMER